MRIRAFTVAAIVSASSYSSAAPAEREVAATELGGKPAVTLSVIRQKLADGGLKLRLVITPKGEKKGKSVTLYEGGADEDGPTDKAFRSAAIEPFALLDGKRGVRVDFEFAVPGSKKHRQVDTFLASIDEAPRMLLEVTTRRERDRTKACHEIEEGTITLDKDGRLFLRPQSVLESELNDDDLPIDKTCKGKHAGQQITYKFDGDKFFQTDPPLAAPKKKAAPGQDEDD